MLQLRWKTYVAVNVWCLNCLFPVCVMRDARCVSEQSENAPNQCDVPACCCVGRNARVLSARREIYSWAFAGCIIFGCVSFMVGHFPQLFLCYYWSLKCWYGWAFSCSLMQCIFQETKRNLLQYPAEFLVLFEFFFSWDKNMVFSWQKDKTEFCNQCYCFGIKVLLSDGNSNRKRSPFLLGSWFWSRTAWVLPLHSSHTAAAKWLSQQGEAPITTSAQGVQVGPV